MSDLVDVDGSVLEGGGQILRVALSLSCIKMIPIRIFNIRSGRSKPGLMEQHLKGVELIRDISSGRLEGAHLGSTELRFWPKEVKGGSFTALVKTAGSISLLMQVALPCVLFAKSPTTLKLHGGTNCEMAPQIDYTTEVFRPILEKFGATFDFDLIRRGYFPKGGGQVIITVNPVKEIQPLNLTKQGQVKSIYGWSFAAGHLREDIAHQMADGASNFFWSKNFKTINIESYKEDRSVAPDPASGIILVAQTDTGCYLGSSALGKRNESPTETGQRAAADLYKSIEQGACVDSYTQDQVIILMALAKGPSEIRVGEITLHTKTAIHVVEYLTKVKKIQGVHNRWIKLKQEIRAIISNKKGPINTSPTPYRC